MANFRGMDGSIQYNGNPVGEVKGMSVQSTIDLMEDTVMGDAWKTQVPGLAEWGGSADVQLDYGDTLGQKAIIDKLLAATPPGTAVTVQFRVSATKYFSGNAILTGIDIQSVLGQIVTAKYTFKGTGALTPTWS